METIVKKLKSFCAWVGKDGFVNALAIYAIMLAVFPCFTQPEAGVIAACIAGVGVSIGKEVFDIFSASCTVQKSWHDLLCDALGMVCAVLTWLLWWLCNL